MSGSQSTRAVWSAVTVGPMLPGTLRARTCKGEIQLWTHQATAWRPRQKKHNQRATLRSASQSRRETHSPPGFTESAPRPKHSGAHWQSSGFSKSAQWRDLREMLANALFVPCPAVTGTSTAHLRKTAVIEIFFSMVLGFAAGPSSDCNWGASKSLPKLDARWRKIARRSIPTTH